MSFSASKVLFFIAQPSSLAAIAIAVGLWLASGDRRRRTGLRVASGGLAFLCIGGIFPLGNVLILPLEERFPARIGSPPDAGLAGIIILGGFEDGWVSAGRGGLAVNESAERLTEGMRLALRHPDTRIVFTGGVGGLWAGGTDATGPVAEFLADAGIGRGRIVLEGRSRNTHENALYTAELVKPSPGQRWALVTSAYHMPRAIGVFRKAGFDVAAYPVDFRTRGAVDLTRLFERIPAGLERLDLAVREWVGLIAYRLTGRTDALLPGP